MDKPYLNSVDHPEDLHKLSVEETTELAQEIRERIIEVMSVNGGHLASNLGSVELTLALHRVFSPPKDKLIWDIGHQTYTHKLITGRKKAFENVRKYRGLSGFCHPGESPFDHFHTGHAGPALSLALGMAHTRDLSDEDDYILPIVGDAAFTCGLTLEALNNMKRELKRFVIILNDNNMSISKNVGRMSHILSRMLSSPTSNRLHQELDALVSRIPSVGNYLCQKGHRISESVKNLVSPAAFFEYFGVSYIGPIDGHDQRRLEDCLEGVKNSNWPVIVHCLTCKGKGMTSAVNNPTPYHGARPFDIKTGKFHPSKNQKRTFPKIFGEHLLSMAESDPDLVAVTPAMAAGSCMEAMMEQHPKRCFDVGIAEGHALTFAGGLAYGGKKRVLACVYSTFVQRALDNLYHDICLQELPVVLCLDRAGIVGGDGAMANGVYDLGFLRSMPNITIAQPRDGIVLQELLNSAFSWNCPTAIRYPNTPAEEPNRSLQERSPGEGEILARGDSSLLLIGLGSMAYTALEVRNILKEIGIQASVLDPVFVKPLDADLLHDLLTTHQNIVTIEEHCVHTGLGAAINNFLLANNYTGRSIINLGIPDTFVQQGGREQLLEELGLTPKKIAHTLQQQLSLKEASTYVGA